MNTRAAGRWAVWGVIALWVAVTALLTPASGKLGSVQNDEPVNYLPQAAQSTQVQQLLKRFPAGRTSTAVVVWARSGGLSAADHARITAARRQIAQNVHTTGPVGPVTRSRDGEAAIFAVPLTSTVKALPTPIAHIRKLVAAGPAGLQAVVTGPAAYSADSSNAFKGIDGTLLIAAGLVVAVLLLAIYRSPLLWLVPLVTAGLAVVVAQAVVYELAKHAGLTVTGLSKGILDVLVFGAGTDYALLIISRYREELRNHEDRRRAMASAMRRAVPAITASAATVVLGLLCLLIASLNSDRGLGPVLAIGVVASLLASLTALPAILVVCGRTVFWPFIPYPGATSHSKATGWARIAARVRRRPRAVWVATACVLAAGAVCLSALQLGLPQAKSFIGTVGAVEGQNLLEKHFPAGSSSPAVVIARTTAAPQVARIVAGTEGVSNVRPTGRSEGLSEFAATLRSAPDSSAAASAVDGMRSRLAGVPGAHALVGGPTAIAADTDRAAAHDRRVIFPLVLAVVLVVLALLLRALVAPLVLIATVILSFAASLGISGLVFRTVFHFAGTDQGVPLYAFVFLVALGVDYNIFLMSRVREEALRSDTRTGTERGLILTGAVITSAGVVLAATFAVLALLPLVVLVEVGFTVAFGILLDTLIVRSILVPALSFDIAGRMWFPSRLWRTARSTAEPPAEPRRHRREPALSGGSPDRD